MLTREEIISSFKKVDFPEKIVDSDKEIKNIIFYSESTEPNSKKEKDIKTISQSYVLPWRLVQKNYNDINNKNNTFNRGINFIPKEQIIDIKIENFKLIYNKYLIPLDIGMIYFKNNYGGMNGPFNFSQIQNMYKNKKIDSTFEFRLIDIFGFKDCDLFKFKSIKIINENNWTDQIVDSPLLKYNKFSDNSKEKIQPKNEELIITKQNVEDKIEDKKEEKNEVIEKKEQKKEEKPAEKKTESKEKKEDKKEEKKEDKKDVIKKEPEQKWELVQKKKSKANKEKEIEEENNEIIGLKPKSSKEGKKTKKKKKQLEDVDFELGFKIK